MKREDPMKAVVNLAEGAFWASVAASYPGAVAGDISPDMAMHLQIAMGNAVEDWVRWNVPGEGHVEGCGCSDCHLERLSNPRDGEMTPAMVEAAKAIWKDFRGYYAENPKPGKSWMDVVDDIVNHGGVLCDYCDGNMFYFEVLSERGLVSEDVEVFCNDQAQVDLRNAVVDYVHRVCAKEELDAER